MNPADSPDGHGMRWMRGDILDAWWAGPGLLLGGEHPDLWHDGVQDGLTKTLSCLAEARIVTILDLAGRGASESGYGASWLDLGRQLGREHRRLVRPIDNHGVIDGRGFADLVAEIDSELAAHRPTYVHCAHGVGRTGMVIGVWLRRCRGLDFEKAMHRIAEARRGTQRADWRCPDTDEQREVVRMAGDVGHSS